MVKHKKRVSKLKKPLVKHKKQNKKKSISPFWLMVLIPGLPPL